MKKQYTSTEIAKILNGKLFGDDRALVDNLSDISKSKENGLSFVNERKYFSYLKDTKSSIIILDEKLDLNIVKDIFLESKDLARAIIVVDNAYSSFIDLMYVIEEYKCNPYDFDDLPESKVSSTAKIFDNVFIDKDVEIGDGTIVLPGSVILRGSRIGKSCVIHPNVSIMHGSIIGDNTVIGSGSVIGFDGFGYIDIGGGKKKIPHIGTVVIEDNVEIGSNSCIDRGTITDTIIKSGTKIDNIVHIAHNCEIGNNTIICGMTGLCGNTIVGNNVIMAAKTGSKGHLKIGDGCVVTALTSVTKDLKQGSQVKGYPARPLSQELKVQTLLGKLPELYNRIKILEESIKNVNSK